MVVIKLDNSSLETTWTAH